MTPRRCVRTEKGRDLKIQRTGEFLFGSGIVLTAIEKDAAIEMRLTRCQIRGIGKRRTASQVVIGKGGLGFPRQFLGASTEEIRARFRRRGLQRTVERGDGRGRLARQDLRSAQFGEKLGDV